RVGAYVGVAVDDLAVRRGHRNDMRLVEAALPRIVRLEVAVDCVLVLLFSRDLELPGHEVRALAHAQARGRLLDARCVRGEKRWLELGEMAELLAHRLCASEVLEVIRRVLAEERANGGDRFHAAGNA